MEVSIRTEKELANEANKVGLRMTNTETNVELATKLLKRQLLGIETLKPNPQLKIESIRNSNGYPEIIWEEMSCYLDAVMVILIQPQFDDLLWETMTHKKHKDVKMCKNEIERVRDTWRDSAFALMQSKRVSLRPFLKTLEDCETYISSLTPFWKSCLNDPIEFVQNALIPILAYEPDNFLESNYRELIEYRVITEHAQVKPKSVNTSESKKKYKMQLVTLSPEETNGGRWLSQPESHYTVISEFKDEVPVFITKKDWEFNSERKVFIYKKNTEEEREVPLAERTDEIGSQVTRKTHTITPFHPLTETLFVAMQSTEGSITLDDVPRRMEKDGINRYLQGVIRFKSGHYTALFYDQKRKVWIDYDTMSQPVDVEEKDVNTKIRTNVRCLVYTLA